MTFSSSTAAAIWVLPMTAIPAVWCSSGSAGSCPLDLLLLDLELWFLVFGKHLARNASKVLRVFLFPKIFAIIFLRVG